MKPPPHLQGVAGLHGSGKSTWLRSLPPDGRLILDDIMRDADGGEARFACCRHREAILAALDAGRGVVLADIWFCDAAFRAEFLAALAGRVVPEEVEWIFFKPQAGRCAANIRHRASVNGWKHPEIPLASNRHFAAVFSVPESAWLLPVYPAAGVWRSLAVFMRLARAWGRRRATTPPSPGRPLPAQEPAG